MAEAHCGICRALGYGRCGECGGPTFDGGDLCGYCGGDQGDEDDEWIVIGPVTIEPE